MKVVFGIVGFAGYSGGHITRALAIRSALDRAGLLKTEERPEGAIEFWVGGWPDSPELWPDSNIIVLPDLPRGDNGPLDITPCIQAFCQLLYSMQPDLLLCDTHPDYFIPLISDNKLRPKNVWAIVRYAHPYVWANVPKYAFDRVYQIENFQTWQDLYNDGIARERTRSEYQKANGLDWRTVHTDGQKYFSGKDEQGRTWYDLHGQYDRKLLAPVVNVDPAKVLPRGQARQEILAMLGQPDTGQPVIFALGGRGDKGSDIHGDFESWYLSHLEKEAGLKPEDCSIFKVGAGYPTITDAYKYLPGADRIYSQTGFNSFNEIRFLWRDLKAIPLHTPIDFYPAGGLETLPGGVQKPRLSHNDQAWRWQNREALMNFPVAGNGADELARLIGRKATSL